MTSRTDTAATPHAGDTDDTAGRPRMWHAAWRQHRTWVIGALTLAALAAVVLVVAVALVPACASTQWWLTPGATCGLEPSKTLWKLFRAGLLVLPILVGALLGAVTFGPEVEHRTQVYALTQGVGRLRWWAVKVVTTSAPVFAALALLGLATLWAVDASDNSVIGTTRLASPGFDFLGLIPATRFLVAYAVAAAAALVWRTVGGVVAGLVAVGVAVVVGSLLQPMVVPHHRDLIPVSAFVADSVGDQTIPWNSAYGWGGYAGPRGQDVDVSNLDCTQGDFTECLIAAGVTYRVETYVPDSEYPRMMLTISALNLLIAGAAFGVGARGLRRRDL